MRIPVTLPGRFNRNGPVRLIFNVYAFIVLINFVFYLLRALRKKLIFYIYFINLFP